MEDLSEIPEQQVAFLWSEVICIQRAGCKTRGSFLHFRGSAACVLLDFDHESIVAAWKKFRSENSN